MSISTFNPFSFTKAHEYTQTGIRLQEAIDYTESRFRDILSSITGDLNIDRKNWVLKLLYRELVSFPKVISILND